MYFITNDSEDFIGKLTRKIDARDTLVREGPIYLVDGTTLNPNPVKNYIILADW